MAKNVTLMGANYPDVPAVNLPQTGGGTAQFIADDELAKKLTVNLNYNSLGLTSTATINQIFSAMPNNSKFIAEMNGTDKSAIDLGFSSGGILEITKASAYRGWAIATSYDTYGFKIGSVLAQNQIFWKTITVS